MHALNNMSLYVLPTSLASPPRPGTEGVTPNDLWMTEASRRYLLHTSSGRRPETTAHQQLPKINEDEHFLNENKHSSGDDSCYPPTAAQKTLQRKRSMRLTDLANTTPDSPRTAATPPPGRGKVTTPPCYTSNNNNDRHAAQSLRLSDDNDSPKHKKNVLKILDRFSPETSSEIYGGDGRTSPTTIEALLMDTASSIPLDVTTALLQWNTLKQKNKKQRDMNGNSDNTNNNNNNNISELKPPPTAATAQTRNVPCGVNKVYHVSKEDSQLRCQEGNNSEAVTGKQEVPQIKAAEAECDAEHSISILRGEMAAMSPKYCSCALPQNTPRTLAGRPMDLNEMLIPSPPTGKSRFIGMKPSITLMREINTVRTPREVLSVSQQEAVNPIKSAAGRRTPTPTPVNKINTAVLPAMGQADSDKRPYTAPPHGGCGACETLKRNTADGAHTSNVDICNYDSLVNSADDSADMEAHMYICLVHYDEDKKETVTAVGRSVLPPVAATSTTTKTHTMVNNNKVDPEFTRFVKGLENSGDAAADEPREVINLFATKHSMFGPFSVSVRENIFLEREAPVKRKQYEPLPLTKKE